MQQHSKVCYTKFKYYYYFKSHVAIRISLKSFQNQIHNNTEKAKAIYSFQNFTSKA